MDFKTCENCNNRPAVLDLPGADGTNRLCFSCLQEQLVAQFGDNIPQLEQLENLPQFEQIKEELSKIFGNQSKNTGPNLGDIFGQLGGLGNLGNLGKMMNMDWDTQEPKKGPIGFGEKREKREKTPERPSKKTSSTSNDSQTLITSLKNKINALDEKKVVAVRNENYEKAKEIKEKQDQINGKIQDLIDWLG